jgi:hypothetical protein
MALFIAMALALFLALGSTIGHWRVEPRYTTRTIPVWVHTTGRQKNQIWWIDNERVLFAGVDDLAAVSTGGSGTSIAPPAIYIWNTVTNEYIRSTELDVLGGIHCYDRGKLRYFVQAPPDDTHKKQHTVPPAVSYETRLGGSARPIDSAPSAADSKRGDWREALFGCAASWEADLVRAQHLSRDNLIWPLWPEDGYLYSPASSNNERYAALMSTPIELWRPGASSPVVLPIMVKEMANGSLYFSFYKNVYVLPAGLRRDETDPFKGGYLPGKERPVYFIARDGTVETKWFPKQDWVAIGHGFLPTVAGYLVDSNFSRRAQSRDAGAWLVIDSVWHKLIDHLVEEFSVSPDGCKAVISTSSPVGAHKWRRTTTAFNFCDEGDGK